MLRFVLWLWGSLLVTAARRLTRGPLRPSWSFGFEVVTRAVKWQAKHAQTLSPVARRAGAEAMVQPSPLFDECSFEKAKLGGVPVEWMVPRSVPADAPVLVYFHGGSFIQGSPRTHREVIVRLAMAAKMRAVAVDFRLAPEHPFPAQLDDALAVVREVARTVAPGRMVLAGDSAGGNLALSVLWCLRNAGDALPAAALLLSPWVDPSARGGTLKTHAAFDWAEPADFLDWSRVWLAGAEETDPRAAPTFASLAGLPPLFVSVGTAEMLEDQVLAFVEKAKAAQVPVELHHAPDMIHDWFLLAGMFPRCGEVLEAAGRFAAGHVQA